MKKDCIIVDLEGTLSNCDHRIHHLNNKDYELWNELFDRDTINEEMRDTILEHIANEDGLIYICTAKSIIHANDVYSWLKMNGIFHLIDGFYYRGADDNRPSVEVKADMLTKILKKHNVINAYDDREDICNMYKKNGIDAPFVSTKKVATDFLQESIDTHKNRDAEYGSSFKEFGRIMMGFFPDGLVLKTEKDFTRFGMLNTMVSKMDRYFKNFEKGGHQDSMTDIGAYSAMMREVDQENE